MTLEQLPARLVAVKPFAGIVTDEEAATLRNAAMTMATVSGRTWGDHYGEMLAVMHKVPTAKAELRPRGR